MLKPSPTQRASPAPTYGTPRRAERPTVGPAVAGVAELFGIRLKPWQRHVADVFGELVPSPDGEGFVWAYTDGSLSVGRRAGKSLLLFLLAVRTMLAGPRHGVRFTAQDRTSAVLQMREQWVPWIETSELRNVFSKRFTNGAEALEMPHNQSFCRLFAPTPTALHGSEAQLVMLDEGFAHSLERGDELTVAVRPTLMTTRGQMLWSSAAGDLDSTWWADVLDRGRAAVAADEGFGRCHFEWTIDGTDLDPDDPATWALCHPGGLPADVLAAAYNANREQFLRTILNMTDRAGSAGSPIDLAKWRAARLEAEPERRGIITLGVDVGPDQSTGTVAAAMAGGRVVELVDHRPGADWIPGVVAALVDRYDVPSVGFEPGGPAGVLVDQFAALGIPTKPRQLRQAAGAMAQFAALVSTGAIRHRPDVSLDAAVEGARRRVVGDGAWTVSRRSSVADVTPLLAVAFAVADHPDTFDGYDPSLA